MKYLLLALLTVLTTDPLKVRRINAMKSEAKDAFQSGDYQAAAEKYTVLIDSMGITEDELMLNRAHAYYLLKDTAHATTDYQSLLESAKNEIVSRASNQLGLLTNQSRKPEEALRLFKQAIKADPQNEDARYNYEMLKKKLDKKKQDEQQKKDQQNQDKNKNQEPSEFAKRLKEMADRLVAQRKYREAHELMTDGLKKDQTVSVYQEYIKRIKDVADINQ